MPVQGQTAFNPKTGEWIEYSADKGGWVPSTDPNAPATDQGLMGDVQAAVEAFGRTSIEPLRLLQRGLQKLPESMQGAAGLPLTALQMMLPENNSTERAYQQMSAQEHPWASGIGTAAAIAPPAIIAGAALPTAGMAARQAAAVRYGTGAGIGAAYDSEDPLTGALYGLGGVLGGDVLGALVTKSRAGLQKFARTRAQRAGLQQAAQGAELPGAGVPEGSVGAMVARGAQRAEMAAKADKYGFNLSPAMRTGSKDLKLLEARASRTPFATHITAPYVEGNEQVLANKALTAMGKPPGGEINKPMLEQWGIELADEFRAAANNAKPVSKEALMEEMKIAVNKTRPLFRKATKAKLKELAQNLDDTISPEELGALQSDLAGTAAALAREKGAPMASGLYNMHDAALKTLKSTMDKEAQASFDLARQRFRLWNSLDKTGVVGPGGKLNMSSMTRNLSNDFKPTSQTEKSIREFVDAAKTLHYFTSDVPMTGAVPGDFGGMVGMGLNLGGRALAPVLRPIYEKGAGTLFNAGIL